MSSNKSRSDYVQVDGRGQWRSVQYLTIPVDASIETLSGFFVAADQGFGGTDSSFVRLVLRSADGTTKSEHKLAVVNHERKTYNYRVSASTEWTDLKTKASVGDSLSLEPVSAPWPAWSCKIWGAAMRKTSKIGSATNSNATHSVVRDASRRANMRRASENGGRGGGGEGGSVSAMDLWTRYVRNVRNGAERKRFLDGQSEGHGTVQAPDGTTMKFRVLVSKKGPAKANGRPLFIAMHGGGGCPAAVNDAQYRSMQTYWFRTMTETAVYVAVRGVTNSWKLHWENSSFPCYDRIIENCVRFLDVDPNRVYLMGYSAGGDGVYRVTPVMPDRLAAANMCAGHPNGVSLMNFMHVPILLEVGEKDTAYNRHCVTVQYGTNLEKLSREHRGKYYRSETRVHTGAAHSYIKNHTGSSSIIASNATWLKNGACVGACDSKNVTASSVIWLNRYVRDPVPTHLIWAVSQPKRPTPRGHNLSQFHYWLDISDAKTYDAKIVEAKYNRDTQIVTVMRTGTTLRILLDERMVKDMSAPVTIHILPQKAFGSTLTTRKVTLRPSRRTMERTLGQRLDPNFIFKAEIAIRFDASPHGRAWDVAV